jgi:excisionase family DNA binding protein
MVDPLPEVLTVAEIAERLKLNQQTIRNWIDDGRLPHLRIGRRVRVYKADYDAFLKAAEPDTSTTAERVQSIWDGHIPPPISPAR